jgi:hypothetical protein
MAARKSLVIVGARPLCDSCDQMLGRIGRSLSWTDL